MEQEVLVDQFQKLLKALDTLAKSMGDVEKKRLTEIRRSNEKRSKLASNEEDNDFEDATAREVVKKDTPVIVNDYSEKAKKFWKDLFKEYFSKPEETQKKPAKNYSFIKDLLTLLGGVLLGAFLFFKEKILPLFKRIFGMVQGFFEFLSGIWKMIDRKSTRLNSSHVSESRMPSSA